MAARLTTYVVVAIVAATLIAGLMSEHSVTTARPGRSDRLQRQVYTADGSGKMAEAVAIRGNQNPSGRQ